MLQPFLDDGSVEQVRVNLEGAKYTLAVPAYLHEAGLARLRRHREVSQRTRRRDLRHRARQRRQRPRARDDPQERVRARRLQARRIERAGHAGAGRARRAREAAGRVPRLGAAPDEHAFRPALPDRRRRLFRAGLRRRHGQHGRSQGLPAGMPERRSTAAEPRFHGRSRERADGPDPVRQGLGGRARARMGPTPPARTRPLARRRTDVRRPPGDRGVPQGGARESPVGVRAVGHRAQDPGRRLGDRGRRMHQARSARLLRRRGGLPDRVDTVRRDDAHGGAGAGADRPDRGARIPGAPFVGARRVRRDQPALHHEPGLLGGDARDADAGARRRDHRDRRSACRSASGAPSDPPCTRRCAPCST